MDGPPRPGGLIAPGSAMIPGRHGPSPRDSSRHGRCFPIASLEPLVTPAVCRAHRSLHMADAFIFDHVRTPRGRGKPDGSLHSITPIQLAAQALAAVRDRNALDTALLDDVVMGCVSPVGEQGANVARVAALVAGYDQTVPGQQL